MMAKARGVLGELFSTRRRKIFALALLALLVFVAVITYLAYHAEPILRARVIETLSTKFHSRVELDDLTVSVYQGLLVSGKGLKIFGQTDPNIHREGMQPLFGVDEFRFRANPMSLLKTPMHVGTVYLKGLHINIPPKGERDQLRNMAPKGGGGKIKIVVDQFHSEDAELIINNDKPDKLPLEFDIHNLVMKNVGPGQPMPFTATLTNPKPVGNIESQGEFGPFRTDDPGESPVSGKYSFDHADLGTIKGIGGILSSTGEYSGTLGNIVVDGETDTPDFKLTISGRPVPLHTKFHAIVDGTSGDTYLQPVDATIGSTPLTAKGYVIKSKDPPGHHIELDVVIPKGKIDDLLKLAVRTDPPVMTGAMHLDTKLDLPAGPRDVSDRLFLHGRFQITGAHFSNESLQSKVDSLSMRSQGKPELATDQVPDNVKSQMGGTFTLKDSLLTLPDLTFSMPGTKVNLEGQYSLDGNQFDFHGHAWFDAKLSQMVGGWKGVLLKPVDPFFAKHGKGVEVPIKITGTKSEPHLGLDFGHKE